MSDEVKHIERPASLLGAERVQQWTRIPHVPNASQPGGLSKPHMLLLIGVVALLHASAWWFFQQGKAAPVVTPPEIPEMTVELTSPAPPAPPVEVPPPPPPPPEPEPPQEDEDAVKEPPSKPVEKPKPIEKPKPVQKPQSPKPAPPAPAAPAAPAAPTSPALAAPTPAPGPIKETAAVSGLASLGNPPPEYPPLALRRSWEGSVGLRIKVLPNGRAGSVEVIKSSGKQALDDAAVEAVRNWKFVPAKRGDTPIEGFATQTIAFKLPE
ncbi:MULTISPECIES: energy transducer TonB [Pseudomonas]|uniref:Energy transducer TonB n=1 Tax=Pseudomonas carnis TaxID=2487355 RepID=A0ABT5R9L7_9PSED|nr:MULTISPECIES: energy transducer TonB [Pseudomonas]MDD1942679.1 energy transducer TonB [Pseudomonas carnis]